MRYQVFRVDEAMTHNSDLFKNTIYQYFRSWERHDIDIVKGIFTSTFCYEIDGKGKITTFHDLEKYWRRNKDRQRRVRTDHSILPCYEQGKARVLFTAVFSDSEDNDYVVVTGLIVFTFNAEGYIENLWERYFKYNYSRYVTFWLFYHHYLRPAYRGIRCIFSTLLTTVSWLVYGVIAVLTVASLLLYFGAFLSPDIFEDIAGTTFRFLSSDVPNNYVELFMSMNNATLGFCSIMLTIFSAFSFYYNKRKKRPDLVEHPIAGEADALQILYKYYARAEYVIVFSGDFSFLSKAGQLNNRVLELVESKKILMVSFNDQATVESAIAVNDSGRNIVQNANFHYVMKYNSKVDKKFSVLRVGGRQYLLYRYTTDDDRNFIYVIKDINESRYSIDIISALAGTFEEA